MWLARPYCFPTSDSGRGVSSQRNLTAEGIRGMVIVALRLAPLVQYFRSVKCKVYCTVYSVHCTVVYSVQCTVFSAVHYRISRCTLYTLHSEAYLLNPFPV
jgi:hypothetical protein